MRPWSPPGAWRTLSPHSLAAALEAAGARRYDSTWTMFLAWATGAGYVVRDARGAPTHFRVPRAMTADAVVTEYLVAGGRR